MATPAITQQSTGHLAAQGRAQPRIAVRKRIFLALICLLVALLVSSEGYLGADRISFIATSATGSGGFRLGAWELQALEQKAGDFFTHPGDTLTPAQQHDLVEAYFDTIGQINGLSGEIEGIHADPEQKNPASTAAPLQARLDALKAQQARRRPAVERILQSQIAEVLASAGLATSGRTWPPVLFQFTESPDYLIISPRTRIALEDGVYLDPGLSVGEMERIEAQVQGQLDVSALVEGTGGFSAYPTMVIAVPDLAWVLDTIAHEWTHTYLAFRPLGLHYSDNGDTRTLNETTASIVGNEIGQATLARFYPDKVPPPAPPARAGGNAAQKPAPPAFDYGATMRETRLHVDQLLAQGHVKEAEDYMEAQRRVFVEHGYLIRKLNQAFFAFHGSYAVGPAATDPIGEKLRTLRQRSATLADFVHAVMSITSVRELDQLLAARR